MKCPQCKADNGADVPVRSCRCGYSSFKSEQATVANPNRGNPGTHLKAMIPDYFSAKDCGCEDYAAKMDRWGIDGCIERQEEIVSHLVKQAKRFAVGRISETLDHIVATHWVNKAIERARDEQRKHV